VLGVVALAFVAADWPQWRGANRDAKAPGFKAPATWPAELKQQWDIVVGDGVATPALVGDKLYVFSREGDGEVVTLGARGMVSCFDAATGKKLWSKNDFRSWPQFFVSSSPIIVDGLAIAQLGGNRDGSIVAYDLATGEQKWKWTGPSGVSPSYASLAVMTVADKKLIIGPVNDGIVAINAADGTHVWEAIYQGTGSRYKAASPVVSGDMLIYLDDAATAVKLEPSGEKFASKNVWTNDQNRVEYNTPVLRDDLLFGITGRGELFCVNTKDAKTAWTAPLGPTNAAPPAGDQGAKGRAAAGQAEVAAALARSSMPGTCFSH
jgi:outer membrane protein assembly factor BamB